MDLPSPGRSFWKGFVLVVGLLTYGTCQVSGHIYISPYSLLGLKGDKATLILRNGTEDALRYSWHRGEDDSADNMIVSYNTSSKQWLQGPKFSGRENVTGSGSLVIQDLELTDSGNYTVTMERANEKQSATGRFSVLELDKEPIATSNTTSVVENIEPIAFFCDTNNTKITWYFNFGKVSSNDLMTISQDNKTLIVHRLQRYDYSVYCQIVTVLDLPLRSNTIRLNVLFGPESMSIKSTPTTNGFTSVLSAEIGSKVEMECTHLQSNPNPKYRWFHNNSLLTVSGTKMTFTMSWNRLGKYRCVVENSATQVILYKDIHVRLPEQYYSKGLTVSGPMAVLLIVVTAMGGVYLCGILVYMLISYRSTRGSRRS